MPSSDRFRRPRPPELTEFCDRLESRLRDQIAAAPRRHARYRSVTRTMRMMARPALHGTMAMIMVAVVFVSQPRESQRPDPTGLAAETTAAGPIWMDVREVADPVPRRPAIVLERRLPRFVTLVRDEPRLPDPLPEPHSPATI